MKKSIPVAALAAVFLAVPAMPAAAAEGDPAVEIAGLTSETVTDGDGRYLRYVGDPAPAGYDANFQRGPSVTVPSPEDAPVTISGTLDLTTLTASGSVGAVGLYDLDALANGATAHKQGATIFVSYSSSSGGRYDIGISDGDAGGGEWVQAYERFTAAEIDDLDGVVDVEFVIDGTVDPVTCASDTEDVPTADGCMTLTVEGQTISDSYGSVSPSGIDTEFGNGAHPGWYAAWSTSPRDPAVSGVGYSLSVSPAVAAPLPAPVEPPAQSSEELQQIIDDGGVDNGPGGFTSDDGENEDDTWTFTPDPDGNIVIDGGMEWSSSDSYVDVYGYSTPVFLGTFPVVDGVVDLSGLDLTTLGSGEHTLVFVGQSSGDLGAVPVFLAAAELADTGVDAAGLGVLGASFVLLGALGVMMVRRRAATI